MHYLREFWLSFWNAIPPMLGAPGGWDYSKPPWWPTPATRRNRAPAASGENLPYKL